MSTLSDRLATLPEAQRQALEWFHHRRGQLTAKPEPVNGVHVFNPQTGIQKPAGWIHAVSVRQTLSSDYEDSSPVAITGGSWTFSYNQERKDPSQAARIATNRALLANFNDDVPVAVMIQEKSKPGVQYRIWGLAKVVDFQDEKFRLQGYDDLGEIPPQTPQFIAPYPYPQNDYPDLAEPSAPFDLEDFRVRVAQQIYVRQGGAAFRTAALRNFDRRCAITGCDVVPVLEAAHIVPYLGAHTNAEDNALLLRADLHTLFDQHLMSISPISLAVELDDSLKTSLYADLIGRVVSISRASSPQTLRQRLVERARVFEGK